MKGFSLVEIIVVLGIMTIAGLILSQIFISTLRSSSKGQIISVIKQNGQLGLEQMSFNIRQADKVVDLCRKGVGASSLTSNLNCLNDCESIIIYKNGMYTRYTLSSETSTKNGFITKDTDIGPLYCGAPATNRQNVTDTDTSSGISVLFSSSSFNIDRIVDTKGTGDIVTIKFDAKPGVGVQSAFPDLDPITFQTSMEVRGQ